MSKDSIPNKDPIAIGWVPNVIGTLAFNILNKDGTEIELADYLVHHASSLDKSGQGRTEQVIHSALCDINDQDIVPETFSRYIRLLIYGEKNPTTKNLEGKIWEIKLVNSKANAPTDQLEGASSTLHIDIVEKLQELINNSNKSSNSRYPTSYINDLSKKIEETLQKKNNEEIAFMADTAKFTLQKDGIFYIYPIERVLLRGSGKVKPLEDEKQQQVAEEFAIRIKQLFHAHHHHSATDDFLSCVPYHDNLEIPFEKLIRNLKYSISHERRLFLSKGFTEKAVANLIGLTAYGKTLTKVCESNLLKREYSSVTNISQHLEYFDNLKTSVEAHKIANSNFMFHILGRPPLFMFPLYRALTFLFPILIFTWISLNLFGISDLFSITDENIITRIKENITLSLLVATIAVTLTSDLYSFFIKYKEKKATFVYFFLVTLPFSPFKFMYKKLPLLDITGNSPKHKLQRYIFRGQEKIATIFRYQNPNKKHWIPDALITMFFIVLFGVYTIYSKPINSFITALF